MKVAILTFARTNNYGATLQCYALNKFIKSLGHETLIINLPLDDGSVRAKKNEISQMKPLLLRRIANKFCYLFYKVIDKFRFHQKNKECAKEPYRIRYVLSPVQREEELNYSSENMKLFDAFREKYLPNMTKEYFEEDDFINDYPDADVYIVGSDQVWNLSITRWQYPLFFLSFVKGQAKRISYAACMGGSENICFTKLQKKRLVELLRKFDYISVRSSISVNILKRFSIDAKQVLDPTLLYDNYDSLAKDSTIDALGYLWFDKYIINDYWIDAIRFVAKEESLKIRSDSSLINISGIPFAPVVSIADWLRLVKTSNFIITDSFHCTIFCILYRKQFITTPSYKDGEGRMIDLLKKLGLEDRFYYSPESVKEGSKQWRKPIDYNSVFEKLNILRIDSKDFLINSLFS